jgi:broad specificity phosphatase PhoE
MATDTNTASVIPLHQPKTPLTPAQRARAYRLRQKAAGKPMTVVTPAVTASPLGPAYPPSEYMPGFGRVHRWTQ